MRPREITIPCEWYWVRAALLMIGPQIDPYPKVDSGPRDEGGRQIWFSKDLAGNVGVVALEGDGASTRIIIEAWEPNSAYWDEVIKQLEQFSRTAQEGRRLAYGASAEGAVEHYYRSRARGSKITLKDIADETGFNYDYLRKVKARYDRAGKYGSKTTTK